MEAAAGSQQCDKLKEYQPGMGGEGRKDTIMYVYITGV